MKQNKLTGFTVIEVMIAVAALAIITAIAIPSYMTYTYKAQVQELIDYAQSQSLLVSDYFAKNPQNTAITSGTCEQIENTTTVNTTVTSQYGIQDNCQSFAISTSNNPCRYRITVYVSPVRSVDGTLSFVCGVTGNSNLTQYVPSTCQSPIPSY